MTPISAIGRKARAGFTLVEVLVVVTIIGLMASVVIIAAPDPRPSVTAEADRFAAHLTGARQEAVLSGRTIEVAADAGGYQFVQVRAGGRQPLEAKVFAPRTWGAGIAPDFGPEGAARITFDPTGLASPASVVLASSNRRVEIDVDSAGNVRVHAPGR